MVVAELEVPDGKKKTLSIGFEDLNDNNNKNNKYIWIWILVVWPYIKVKVLQFWFILRHSDSICVRLNGLVDTDACTNAWSHTFFKCFGLA